MPAALRRDGANNFSQLTNALPQIRVDDSEAVGSGVGTGAPIGNRVQALDKQQGDLDDQIEQNELELQRQRAELEMLKKEFKER